MANPYDQFDQKTANPYDQFGATTVTPDKPEMSAYDKVMSYVRPMVRPTLEGAGLIGGGIIGSATAPVAGTLAGAGLGYGIGKGAADWMLGENLSQTPQQAVTKTASDIATGVTAEMGGQLLGPLIQSRLPQRMAESAYKSAMKFNRGLGTATTPEQMNEWTRTGLKYGIVPSEDTGLVQRLLGFRGKQQINELLDGFESQVQGIITDLTKQGKTVSAVEVAKRLDPLLVKGESIAEVDPAYTAAVQNVKDELLSGRAKFPANDANEMKRHIYKSFRDYYDSPTSHQATVSAKKATAEGLKSELEALDNTGQLGSTNAQYGDLVDFLDPFNRALTRVNRRDAINVGLSTAMNAGHAAAGSAGAGAGFIAKTLEAPGLKSRGAVLLNNLYESTPAARVVAQRMAPVGVAPFAEYLNKSLLGRDNTTGR